MRYLCLDTGGTSVKYSVADENGDFRCTGRIPVGKTVQEFLDNVENLWQEMEKQGKIDGIACSFPGEVCSEEGVIRGISAVEQLHNYPIRDELSKRCNHLPVTMLNDATAAALGEQWLGVGKNYKNVAFVIVGTGVGGAVIENGSLYVGSTRNKAEIGNFLMGGVRDGQVMAWSCFTLEKEARRYSALYGEKVNGKELLQRSRQGDETAKPFVDEFFHYMAVGCVDVLFAYDPEIIAIGGGISEDKELVAEIGRTYEKLISGQRMAYLKPKIVACEKGNQANLLGALRFFKLQIEEENRQ